MPKSLTMLNDICQVNLPSIAFEHLHLDSRKVNNQSVFIALKGAQFDGRNFIAKAVQQGAVAVLADADESSQHGVRQTVNSVPVIFIWRLSHLQADIAACVSQADIAELALIGVTGTNGKTTVANMVFQALLLLDRDAAYVGTLGVQTKHKLQPLLNTTPVAIELHDLLTAIAKQQDVCCLEVSSHALAEQRIKGLAFQVTAFTNLSHDHLDFHGDMQGYFAAKTKLFSDYESADVVINLDCSWGQKLAHQVMSGAKSVRVVSRVASDENSYFLNQTNPHGRYLIVTQADAKADGFELSISSESETASLFLPFYGDFNIENALVAMACLLEMNYSLADIAKAFAQVKPIAGRMEHFGKNSQPNVIVDFAHTPDGLEKALVACRRHLTEQGQLFVVFGCGGDRDTDKRPVMGQIAAKYADKIFVTNDNSRSESPELIAKAILKGISDQDKQKVVVELDRKLAIQSAVQAAQAQDIILVAGKGHETTQEIAGIKHAYNEREYVQQLMEQAA
ncbi:UDP-N-acetylmuramoyl-L-alanyl-D-glutamate--2,6-diaminopimelate ligase [Saccharobesus litoralis]|uniref:UDP-N-acetylmuramoyl-L-alanyl-D-glutamate--2, 6-diaminopimelate ligase n=1 Tax=Saccharobesus litoralis TaxID=2172099 RepID=UPI00131F1C36|nr:UDP-N-acetylmuramoyl-L-alanyl-D-glutamate--2,6-diaminopimelate ligase [Saccharobesus litoralis]